MKEAEAAQQTGDRPSLTNWLKVSELAAVPLSSAVPSLGVAGMMAPPNETAETAGHSHSRLASDAAPAVHAVILKLRILDSYEGERMCRGRSQSLN